MSSGAFKFYYVLFTHLLSTMSSGICKVIILYKHSICAQIQTNTKGLSYLVILDHAETQDLRMTSINLCVEIELCS